MDHRDLAHVLFMIAQFDTDYDRRYPLVLQAVQMARSLGIDAGFGYDHTEDPEFDGYRIVAYIELPSGQVSWHMPEHPIAWDGHDTTVKYRRLHDFVESVLG